MKIVMIGDSPTLSSGFARVNKMIAEGFIRAGHEVQFVGWCYRGEPYNQNEFPYLIHPVDYVNDYWGTNVLPRVLSYWKPDIIFSLGDPWMVYWIADLPERKGIKWVSYFPIDGEPIPPKWLPTLDAMDVPIVFSKFAVKLMEKQLPHKKTYFIYHGVDTRTFFPLPQHLKDETRQANNLQDRFVVGCVARNQPRKNIPALIKAYAKFSQNKNNTTLYLHMSKRDVGWDIDDLLIRYGLQGKVYVTDGVEASKGVPDHVLNQIYNLFDIMVLPTMGEGFGLPILESQACGVPVIVTDYSACTELIPYKEGRAKVKTVMTNNSNLDHALIDEDDIVQKLNAFYKDRNLLKRCAKQGYEFAKDMTWNKYIGQFVDLIANVEKEIKKEKGE